MCLFKGCFHANHNVRLKQLFHWQADLVQVKENRMETIEQYKWERLEISSSTLDIPREHFIQRWTQ